MGQMGLATLKRSTRPADTRAMTTVNPAIRAWATRPTGKATRIAIAGLGLATATLILMTASIVSSGEWALVLLGVGIAATATRAAVAPSATRLIIVALAMGAVPFVLQSL